MKPTLPLSARIAPWTSRHRPSPDANGVRTIHLVLDDAKYTMCGKLGWTDLTPAPGCTNNCDGCAKALKKERQRMSYESAAEERRKAEERASQPRPDDDMLDDDTLAAMLDVRAKSCKEHARPILHLAAQMLREESE